MVNVFPHKKMPPCATRTEQFRASWTDGSSEGWDVVELDGDLSALLVRWNKYLPLPQSEFSLVHCGPSSRILLILTPRSLRRVIRSMSSFSYKLKVLGWTTFHRPAACLKLPGSECRRALHIIGRQSLENVVWIWRVVTGQLNASLCPECDAEGLGGARR